MSEFVITPETLWHRELLYWRRMGSKDIADYLAKTSQGQRLVLVPWGVLEAHGPWLPTAQDSMMAHVVADVVALRLYRGRGVQPIIFDSFQDIGSYSATRGFVGAVALEGWQEYQPGEPSPILSMWEQLVQRLMREGFGRCFIVNGDGGNWMNYFDRSLFQVGFESITDLLQQKYGVVFQAMNWDQEGVSWPHGSHFAHACVKWVCDYAPDFIRLAALRAGLTPAPEQELHRLEGEHFAGLTAAERRNLSWADDPRQKDLHGVNKFYLTEYYKLLYEGDGTTPLKEGGIAADFEAKVGYVMQVVLEMMRM